MKMHFFRFMNMEEGLAHGHSRCHTSSAEDQAEATLKEFRKPRNSLLCVVSSFYSHSVNRVKELKRSLADPTIRAPDLLDHKSHNVSTSSLVQVNVHCQIM